MAAASLVPCVASFLQHLCPELLLPPLLLQSSSPEKKILLRYHHATSPLHDQTHFSQFLTTAVDLQSVQQENNWGRTHSWKRERCLHLLQMAFYSKTRETTATPF